MGNNTGREGKNYEMLPKNIFFSVDDVFVFSCGLGAEKTTHKEAENRLIMI